MTDDAPRPVPAWAEGWVRLLDDGIRVPLTNWRIGLDGILGLLLPAAGDAFSAVSALSLFLLAYRQRVPHSVLVRMLLNVAIDVVIGCLPVLGDLFDFAWKANRRNLTLIQRAAESGKVRGQKPSFGDRVLVVSLVLILMGLLLLPFVFTVWLIKTLLANA